MSLQVINFVVALLEDRIQTKIQENGASESRRGDGNPKKLKTKRTMSGGFFTITQEIFCADSRYTLFFYIINYNFVI